jgi:cytochrome c oxidase subunit 1
MGTEQINIIIHNTIYVPGHFHATVVVGTTMAWMALTYLLIPVLFRREMILPAVAKWQPYVFGLGMTMVSVFLMAAGTLGVARRHWDMGFAGNPLGFQYPGTAYVLMGIAGIGAILAALGGAMYLLVTVGSLVFGKKLEPSAGFLQSFGKALAPAVYNIEQPEQLPMASRTVVEQHGSAGFHAPGTFVLALVLLVSFVLYYAINWNYLAAVWPLR